MGTHILLIIGPKKKKKNHTTYIWVWNLVFQVVLPQVKQSLPTLFPLFWGLGIWLRECEFHEVSESLRPIGAAVVVVDFKKSNVLGNNVFFFFKVVDLVVGKNFNTCFFFFFFLFCRTIISLR